MIITRAPLRITLGGGGTDVPSFYQKHGGFCVAAAIDKYVYISVHRTFDPGITLKYSEMEHVKSIDEVKHPIIREALKLVGLRDPHIEITSHADIPAGTGLGSSSSFTVALLAALYEFQGLHSPSPRSLAELACEIEIDRLKEPIGKQDQYAAAYGGVHGYTFCPDGTVEIENFSQKGLDVVGFPRDLLMFYTGKRRSTSSAMKDQDDSNLMEVLTSGWSVRRAIQMSEFQNIAPQINKQWDMKLKRTANFDADLIDIRQRGMLARADAGKLIGAGGGGFMMFYCPYFKDNVRAAMFEIGLPELRFSFDQHGVKVVAQ